LRRDLVAVEPPGSIKLRLILLIALILAMRRWPYRTGWGCYASSGFGLLVIVLLMLISAGRL
jgi:hypothetical protein